MPPKIFLLHKAKTVRARKKVIARTFLSFSWSSENNKLSTFWLQHAQVMMEIPLQTQLFYGFLTFFGTTWMSKCFNYLWLIFVIMFMMARKFCIKFFKEKAGLSFVINSNIVLPFLYTSYYHCKATKWHPILETPLSWFSAIIIIIRINQSEQKIDNKWNLHL